MQTWKAYILYLQDNMKLRELSHMLAEKIRIWKDVVLEGLGRLQDELNHRQMKSLLSGKKEKKER